MFFPTLLPASTSAAETRWERHFRELRVDRLVSSSMAGFAGPSKRSLALKPLEDSRFQEQLTQIQERVRKNKGENLKPGVIFLGRLPSTLNEDHIYDYFTQFGTISRFRLSRSKRTGNSRGYAFVEFECEDVAKIVAETMDNYLFGGRLLSCEYSHLLVLPKPKKETSKGTLKDARYFEFLLQGLRINMELFMKIFRWQRSLRTEGIEGTGGCINNSIALCQRTSFANSSAPFSISSSAVSASKHSFTRAQIVLDSHLSSRSPYGPPTAPRQDPD
ncbi:hypothetical protein STEG23_023154 [Scotinomys teguina]